MKSICEDVGGITDQDTGFKYVLAIKQSWIVFLGLMLLPVVVKKELQELHIVSLSLFVAILIFIAIMFLQLCLFGTETFTDGQSISFS